MPYALKTPLNSSALSEQLGLDLVGDDLSITMIAALGEVETGGLSFANKAIDISLQETVLIASQPMANSSVIISENPRLDFIRALYLINESVGFEEPMDRTAIHPSVSMGKHVVVGKNVTIDEGTHIDHHVVIRDNVSIGKYCHISSHVVIGEDGFGYERDENNVPIKFLHFGTVVIGDRVSIGSSCAIDRGTLSNTTIGDDTKLDNMVHVAHNCKIGQRVLVTACVEMSGGVTVEDDVWIGPNVSLMDQITLAQHTFIGIGTVVTKSSNPGEVIVGNPGRVIKVNKPD
jgi:acyl-[acyl carrier protein]--UDP-N-acetylglucosamine O-acyltransferase